MGQRHTPELRLELRFDESFTRAKAGFAGPGSSLPEVRPAAAMLLEKEEGLPLFSGYMLRAFCKSI